MNEIDNELVLCTLTACNTISVEQDLPFIVILSEKRWNQLLEAIENKEVERMVGWEEQIIENKEWTKTEDFRMIKGFWNTLWIKDKKITNVNK